ncbi:MAG: hypothetical protein LBR53_04395 [Deltaproteobacteria bacterium]|jgi:hypothetical protein|nr:hypothetical protein [Deltaproteobacteria bacterium]
MDAEILANRDLERPRDTPGKPVMRRTVSEGPGESPTFGSALLLGLAIMVILGLISKHLGSLPFVFSVLLVIAAAIPIYVSLSYFDSVKDALMYQNLDKKGFIYRFLRRRLLSNVFSAALSVFLACGLLLNLATLKRVEWPFVYLALPVQLVVFSIFHRLTRKELSPWHLSPYFSSAAASWFSPFLMILIYTFGMSYISGAAPHLSPSEAVSSQAELFPAAASGILHSLNQWYALVGGGRDFALGLAQPLSFPAWFFLNLLFTGTLFFSVSSLLRLVTIPGNDLRRVSGRTAMKAEKSSFFQFFLAAVLPVLLIGLLFFISSLKLELVFSGETGRKIDRFMESFNVYLVMIDGEYYDSGILKALADENISIAETVNGLKAELKTEVDKVFDGYQANVDSYLDWYYSLPAEYGRLLTLVLGEIEEYMAYNLSSRLSSGVDASGIARILARLNGLSSSVNLDLLKERYRYTGPVNVKPALVLDSKKFNPGETAPIFIPYQLRRVISATAGLTAGLAAGVLVKRLVEKIVSKIIFKMAAKALAKGAATRGAAYGTSAAAGSLTGAAVGSVVPGLGTGVGAAIGGLVGVGTAFLADKIIIELEETISRDEFKTNILNSIKEQRRQIHQLIDAF